jgi:DNA polymerase-3 subunit chi
VTRIHFLHGARDRHQAAVAWLAQRSQNGLPALVYLPDQELLAQLDRLLWTHTATGFIPHCHVGDPLQTETPIVLTTNIDTIASASPGPFALDRCLVNLTNDVPPGFSRFEELIEIISMDNNDRLPGRERFRFYRERGYDLQSVDISNGIPA